MTLTGQPDVQVDRGDAARVGGSDQVLTTEQVRDVGDRLMSQLT